MKPAHFLTRGTHLTTAGAFAAALLAPLALPSTAQSQTVSGPRVEWRHSVWGNPRAFTAGIEKLSEIVSERTRGQFTIKVFYGAQLSKSRENLDGIKLGAFQSAFFCNFYHPGKNPAFMVFSLPFLPLADWKTSVAVRDTLYKHPALVNDMKRWNAITYASTLLPQYEFMGKGRSPLKLEHWKGLRVRAGGGVGEAMERLGATRTTVTATEVYTALQRGTVDAASFPYTYAHAAYKLHEIADWYTTNLSPGTADCPFVFNKDAWDNLPPQYRRVITEAKPEVTKAQIAAYVTHDKRNLPLFRTKLRQVVYGERTLKRFREIAGKPVWDAWISRNRGKFDAQDVFDTVFRVAAQTR